MATTSGRPGRVAAILAISLLSLAGGRLAAADKPPKSTAEVNPEGDKAQRERALALNDITGDKAVNGEIVSLYKDEANTRRLLAAAARMAKQKDQPFNANATYILAATAHLLKDVDTAEVFYRLNLEQAIKMSSAQKINKAFSGLYELLLTNKKYAECEKVCSQFLDNEDETLEALKPAVLRRKILVMARQNHYDKANELLDKLIKAQPDNWLNVVLKGDLLREEGKNADSAKLYEDLVAKVKDDKRLDKETKDDFISDLQYRLSGVYIDIDQVDKAADNLKALLAKEPDNPTYNNDLGYIWADHDKNLAESEKLIRKALDEDRKQRHKDSPDLKPEEDKDNAAFLDSLGWVLFKQKKYKEAKPPLLQAVTEPEGKHIEIYDHLGDVHLALGEKAEAVAAWKKGIEAAGTTPREQQRKVEVEKKLKEYEKATASEKQAKSDAGNKDKVGQK
jgi:tetratricopeptide (TPR) repeat protein